MHIIFYQCQEKSNEKVTIRYILSNDNGNVLFLQINNE